MKNSIDPIGEFARREGRPGVVIGKEKYKSLLRKKKPWRINIMSLERGRRTGGGRRTACRDRLSALPGRVLQTFRLVHLLSSFHVLDGPRLGIYLYDGQVRIRRIRQTFTLLRQRRRNALGLALVCVVQSNPSFRRARSIPLGRGGRGCGH